MLYKINKDSAKILDKLIAPFNTSELIIQFHSQITIFLKLPNNHLICSILLLPDFFDLNLQSSDSIAIPKTNFYFSEMELLSIQKTDLELIFNWEFKDHLKKRVFIIGKKNPYKCIFEMTNSFVINGIVLKEIIKCLFMQELQIEFKNKIIFKSGLSTVTIENDTGLDDVSFSVLKRPLQLAFDNVDVPIEVMLDLINSKLCVVVEAENCVIKYVLPIVYAD